MIASDKRFENYPPTIKQAQEAGSKFYFTGIPCKNGHIDLRYTSVRTCRSCKMESIRKWNKENREDRTEKARVYRENNREKVNKWARERHKIRYMTDKEFAQRRREYTRKWYAGLKGEDKKRFLEASAKWARENPEKRRAVARAAQARIRSTRDGKAIAFMRRVIYEASKGIGSEKRTVDTLGYTVEDFVAHMEKQFNGKMSWDNYGDYWHVDHIVPVKHFFDKGIRDPKVINCLSNLRPLKAKENLAKGAKVEYLL